VRILGMDQKARECTPYMRRNRTTGAAGITCNPPGRGFHEAEYGKKFSLEDDAVAFLTANPSWGVWLKAKGQPGSLFFNFAIDGVSR
jgi:hypothetical protein